MIRAVEAAGGFAQPVVPAGQFSKLAHHRIQRVGVGGLLNVLVMGAHLRSWQSGLALLFMLAQNGADHAVGDAARFGDQPFRPELQKAPKSEPKPTTTASATSGKNTATAKMSR